MQQEVSQSKNIGDGIFDRLSNTDVVSCIWRTFRNESDPNLHSLCGKSVENVMKAALALNTLDNITGVLVTFIKDFENKHETVTPDKLPAYATARFHSNRDFSPNRILPAKGPIIKRGILDKLILGKESTERNPAFITHDSTSIKYRTAPIKQTLKGTKPRTLPKMVDDCKKSRIINHRTIKSFELKRGFHCTQYILQTTNLCYQLMTSQLQIMEKKEREDIVKHCQFHEQFCKAYWKPNLRLYRLKYPEKNRFYIMKEVKQENFALSAAMLIKQPISHLVELRKISPAEPFVHLVDISTDKKYMYYLYDNCTGIPLSEYAKATLCEDDIKGILKDVLESLKVYHNSGITHGNVKPNNVFVEGSSSKVSAVLADLLTARYPSLDCQWLFSSLEEPAYIAPEILKAPFYDTKTNIWSLNSTELSRNFSVGTKADIWSIGILAYQLSQGKPPFGTTTVPEVLQNIANGDYKVVGTSGTFADFIAQCLQVEDNKRPTCAQLLEHPFIQAEGELFENIPFDGNDAFVLNCNNYVSKTKSSSKKAEEDVIKFSMVMHEDVIPLKSVENAIDLRILDDVVKLKNTPELIYTLEWPDKLFVYNTAINERHVFYLPFKVTAFAATAAIEDTIYISGGYDKGNYLKQLKSLKLNLEFDTTIEKTLKPMQVERVNHQMVPLNDGTLLAIGGTNECKGKKLVSIAGTEIYDIRKNEWIEGPKLNVARSFPGVVLVGNKTVAVIGGWNPESNYLSSIELCYFSGNHSSYPRDKWTLINVKGMPALSSIGAVQVAPGELFLFGGNTFSGPSDKCYKLSFNSSAILWAECGHLPAKDVFQPGSVTRYRTEIYTVGWMEKNLYSYSMEKKGWSMQHRRVWLNMRNLQITAYILILILIHTIQ
eukprot:TRINITY_DN740_c0_g1_i2.p1 TRINITY_DN740_c0_g1~~TRINITY_DN740_c0_g1_i2.p1  ORF type:complete len:887 (+),score=51.16 TRINITY_DN740_c0_g1_i2:1178-3838(+)